MFDKEKFFADLKQESDRILAIANGLTTVKYDRLADVPTELMVIVVIAVSRQKKSPSVEGRGNQGVD